MPGVLIVEALAQAAAILSFKTHATRSPDDNSLYYFVGHRQGALQAPVSPATSFMLNVTLVRCMRGIWKFCCTGEGRRDAASPKPNSCARCA